MRRTRDGFGSTTTNVKRADSDDFESLCIMDRYFCRAENPPTGVLEKFVPHIKVLVKYEYQKYKTAFKKISFEEDDVYSLALCYATSFLGLYSIKKDAKKMANFVERFQKKNNTTDLPSDEVLFKKEKSDMTDFIKQKISTLADNTKKNCEKIYISESKTVYFKVKDRVEISESSLLTIPNGYKGYVKIKQSEYLEERKKVKSKRTEFESGGWTYFSYTKESQPFLSLETEEELENNSGIFLEKCGIVDCDDVSDVVEKFKNLSDREKVNVLKRYIKQNKRRDKELLEVAKDLLEFFQK
jgi:hypothetical protein